MMHVVSPYRPFPPESPHHQRLGAFDWVGACQMLATSARISCACETHVITDVDTNLPVPAWQFETTERRLMLWILDVSLQFLKSEHFDRDTVMVCPDLLIFGNLAPYFAGDLGVIVRPSEKHQRRPVVNGAQWWPVASKLRLQKFYTQALALAKTLPEALLVWGADTEPIRQLVEPVEAGVVPRAGLAVHMLNEADVMPGLSSLAIARLERGEPQPWPLTPLVDFRVHRKLYMRDFFQATFGAAVSA